MSDEQFSKLGRPLIPELAKVSGPQGTQIAGMLEVFHQIHCVVSLHCVHKYLDKDSHSVSELRTDVHIPRIL